MTNLEQYWELHNKLIEARAAGSDEDSILDEMDIVWYKLSEEEQKEINEKVGEQVRSGEFDRLIEERKQK